VVIIVTIFNIMFQGYLNFLPTYLQDVKSLSPVTSSVIFALFFVSGAVSNPVAGRIGDRFGHPPIAVVSSVLAIVGLGMIVVTESVVGITLSVVIVAAGGTAMWPVMTAFIMDQVPEASKGGDLGAVSAIYFTVGSIGPTYVGWIATRWDFSVAYLSLTPALVVTLALAGWLTLKF